MYNLCIFIRHMSTLTADKAFSAYPRLHPYQARLSIEPPLSPLVVLDEPGLELRHTLCVVTRVYHVPLHLSIGETIGPDDGETSRESYSAGNRPLGWVWLGWCYTSRVMRRNGVELVLALPRLGHPKS
jgi:hypothetical protein